jgi:PAS domain S-box-containing protein
VRTLILSGIAGGSGRKMNFAMSDWRSAMGMLERDSALAPYMRQSAIFIWSLDGKVILSADAAGEELRLRLGEGFGERARERIRLMGQGLAPLSGVRLERLSLSPDPSHPPLTCACRRIRLATGKEGLLILAQTAALPQARAQADETRAEPPREVALPALAEMSSAGQESADQKPADQLPAVHVPVDHVPAEREPAGDIAAAIPAGAEAPARPVEMPVAVPRRMRFVWSSDAEGRLTGLSPEFLALLRLDEPGQVIGRRWLDLINDRLRDAGGRLAAGLASEATFSDAPVLFRIGQTNGALSTTLSGSPVFAAGRAFEGYRGFGALRPVPAAGPGQGAAPAASAMPKEPDPEPAAPAAQTADTHVADHGLILDAAPAAGQVASPDAPAPAAVIAPPAAPTVQPIAGGLKGLFPDAPFRSRQRKERPTAAATTSATAAQTPDTTAPDTTAPETTTAETTTAETTTPEANAPAQPAAPVADGGGAPPMQPGNPQDVVAAPSGGAEAAPAMPVVEPAQPAGNDDVPARLPAVATLQSRLTDMLRQGLPDAPATAEPAVLPPGPMLRPLLAPAKADLTPAERQAFRQIAEALGAEIAETAPPQLATPSPAPAAVVASQAADAAAPALAPVHDAAVQESTVQESTLQESTLQESPSQESTSQEAVLQEPAAQAGDAPDSTTQDSDHTQPADQEADDHAIGAKEQVARQTDPPQSHQQEPASPEANGEAKAGQAAETLAGAETEPSAPAEAGAPGPDSVLDTPQIVPKPAPRPSFAAAARALAQDGHAELLDKLPVGVLVSRNGEVAYGNRTFLDLLGYDDLADIVRHGGMENLFRGRAPDEGGGAVLLVAKDGDLETVEARLSAIAWQGRPATLMSFRRAIEADAPARARALELDLDASRKRLGELSSILDTATDGVVTLDERGRILSLNSAAEALFGYDQREVTGEIISMLFAPESHAPAMDYLDGLKGGGVASVLNDGREVVGMVRQGGRVPLFMTMGRIADGEDAKFCAVLRDITAWKKAESELTEARKAAEQASAQKSDVLAKISHEIRTPLNAIIGFSEVMAEERFGPMGSERYKEYARDIRESGNYLISLVNDLLDLAKIEAGRLDLDFESVNLNDIANSAVSLLQPEAARNRVVLRTGLSTRLPPVVADDRSLRQIVINLLSNAVKFTDSGGQVIVSTALGDKGEAILRVRDTGIGMTPEQLKLALEPFRQVSATRRGGGTGLGLPLTKALVEANRGAFQISSVPKEGTLAEVVFPPQRVLAG